ncbi:MAG: hemerythrin domain-containing protein [Caldimonas sp.]
MAKETKRAATAEPAVDAIDLLTNDHQEVRGLFEQYDELAESEADDAERQSLAEEICTMLSVHATIEEEIFYPAARDALDDDGLLNEAEVEHQSAKDLIAQIQASDPGDSLYDAQVKVLGEYVNHHVEEEEGELFPQVREAGLDLEALGAEMSARQEELLTASAEDESV